jgi:thioesterase domain-containing protein
MLVFENGSELMARLSSLSPAKRAWLEQKIEKRRTERGRAAVVQLQEGEGVFPIYFVYAGPEEVLLAQMMGPRHRIFGIEMPWPMSWREAAARNIVAELPTMERLVAPFVDALSAHLGASACVLVGWSFAGMMAFEAARRLQALGGNVAAVVLIDTSAKLRSTQSEARFQPVKRWARTIDRMRLERLVSSSAPGSSSRWHTLLAMCQWSTMRMVRLLKGRGPAPHTRNKPVEESDFLTTLVDDQGAPLPWSLVERMYQNVAEHYEARPLACHGILFRADLDRADSSLGWEGLFTKGLEIVPLTGDHHAILRDKAHRESLSQKMRGVLETLAFRV